MDSFLISLYYAIVMLLCCFGYYDFLYCLKETFFFFFLVILGFELKALFLLCWSSTAWARPPVLKKFFCWHKLIVQRHSLLYLHTYIYCILTFLNTYLSSCFVICFKVSCCNASSFVLCAQDCFGFLSSFVVLYEFWFGFWR
jgi:hypothetical protein